MHCSIIAVKIIAYALFDNSSKDDHLKIVVHEHILAWRNHHQHCEHYIAV